MKHHFLELRLAQYASGITEVMWSNRMAHYEQYAYHDPDRDTSVNVRLEKYIIVVVEETLIVNYYTE